MSAWHVLRITTLVLSDALRVDAISGLSSAGMWRQAVRAQYALSVRSNRLLAAAKLPHPVAEFSVLSPFLQPSVLSSPLSHAPSFLETNEGRVRHARVALTSNLAPSRRDVASPPPGDIAWPDFSFGRWTRAPGRKGSGLRDSFSECSMYTHACRLPQRTDQCRRYERRKMRRSPDSPLYLPGMHTSAEDPTPASLRHHQMEGC